MKFIPTQEQADIFDFIKSGRGNLVVAARAGCAKTTTAIEAIKYLPPPLGKSLKPSITFCCFNDHIKEELQTKVPEGVFVNTMHSLGYGAIQRKYGKVPVDEYKVHKIVRKLSTKWDHEHRQENYLDQLIKIVKMCKLTLSLREKQITYIAKTKCMVDLDKEGEDVKKILKILDVSTQDMTSIDFDDMVYIPATDNKIWFYPQDFIFVDEAQDLNKAQHMIVSKMRKKTKLGVVGKFYAFGDPFQSIMGFSGSDPQSFEWFAQQENTHVLPLTYTFRCGKAIVKEANALVPDIKANAKNPEGLVNKEGDVINESKAGDFVLCRNNKPLVRLFFELFLKNKKSVIKGSDFGRRIVELVDKYNKKEDMVDELNYQLNKYRLELIDHGISDYEKHPGYSAQKDFVDCVLLINKTITNISQMKARVKQIFCDDTKVHEFSKDSIILSTIHKSKGLEADRVFIVKPQLLLVKQPMEWMDTQENNLKYVAITRARHELIYDNKWTDEKDKEENK
jgi:DNA helicase-2/ATP-dependent DNA helicase PcrA